jgi:hypothetical protein
MVVHFEAAPFGCIPGHTPEMSVVEFVRGVCSRRQVCDQKGPGAP